MPLSGLSGHLHEHIEQTNKEALKHINQNKKLSLYALHCYKKHFISIFQTFVGEGWAQHDVEVREQLATIGFSLLSLAFHELNSCCQG